MTRAFSVSGKGSKYMSNCGTKRQELQIMRCEIEKAETAISSWHGPFRLVNRDIT